MSVVGIPDPEAINLPAAVVIKRSGFEHISSKHIKDAVAEKFPKHKHLSGGVYFVDELPTTPTGKIKKKFVAEIALKLYKLQKTTDVETMKS